MRTRQPRLYVDENDSLVIPSVERDLAKASRVLYGRFLTMFETFRSPPVGPKAMTETNDKNRQSEARYIHTSMGGGYLDDGGLIVCSGSECRWQLTTHNS